MNVMVVMDVSLQIQEKSQIASRHHHPGATHSVGGLSHTGRLHQCRDP